MSSRILGLDIRSHAVHAVVVHAGFKTERVEAHFQVPLTGPGEFVDQLATAIDDIVDRVNIKDVFCQISLPSEWIIYRNITIPIKGQGKIRQILPFELEPSLAQPVETLIFDFELATTIDAGNENHLVVAAVERTHLKICLDVLKNAGIDPDMITAGSCVLAGCLPKVIDLADKAVLVALGRRVCEIYILVSGEIGIARAFRFSSGERSGSDLIGTYLNQTLAAFEERFNLEFDPETVYVNQTVATNQTAAALALEKKLGYPVKPIDLADVTRMSIDSNHAAWQPQRMNNALALCLARILSVKTFNFRRGDYGKRLFLSEQRTPLIKVAVLVGVVAVLGILAVVLDGYFTKKSLQRLDEQVTAVFTSTFPEIRRIVDPLQQMRVKIRQEKLKISQMGGADRNVAMIDMLNDISRFISSKIDVTLTGMSFGVDNMLLSGHAGQFEMVDDIRMHLEKAEWVDQAIISSANQDKSGQRVDFKIKLIFTKGTIQQDT